VDALANAMVVPPKTLQLYLSGEREIPLARQMVLAKLLIERFPQMAREGYALQSQVTAAIAIQQGAVTLKA
jgi:hypothetical protein